MEFLGSRDGLMRLVNWLGEARKLSYRKEKLKEDLLLVSILLFVMIYSSNVFCLKPSFPDSLVPTTPRFYISVMFGVLKDINFFLGFVCIYLIIYSLTSPVLIMVVIYASACIGHGQSISFEDLLLSTLKSRRKPLVTCFYITLFLLGWVLFLVLVLSPLAVFNQTSYAHRTLTSTLSVLAMSFMSYLAVVSNLSLVISILEEAYGIQALAKAVKIVKGARLYGFCLNFAFFGYIGILFRSMWSLCAKTQEKPMVGVYVGLIAVLIFILTILLHMAYVSLYFDCKESHVEQLQCA